VITRSARCPPATTRRAVRRRQGHLPVAMHRAPHKDRRQGEPVTNRPASAHHRTCRKHLEVDETPLTVVNKPQYWGASGGLEYEAAWGWPQRAGPSERLEALTYANFPRERGRRDRYHSAQRGGRGDGALRVGRAVEGADRIEEPFGSAKAVCNSRAGRKATGFAVWRRAGSRSLSAKVRAPELS